MSTIICAVIIVDLFEQLYETHQVKPGDITISTIDVSPGISDS